MLNYNTIAGLVEQAEQTGKPVSELVLAQQAEQTERPVEDLYEEMRRTFQVMEESVTSGIDPRARGQRTERLDGADRRIAHRGLLRHSSGCGADPQGSARAG